MQLGLRAPREGVIFSGALQPHLRSCGILIPAIPCGFNEAEIELALYPVFGRIDSGSLSTLRLFWRLCVFPCFTPFNPLWFPAASGWIPPSDSG